MICAGVFGACMGFLWYNAYPAQVFMGDVGALPLGGIVGTLAVLLKQEFLFVITGGIFVAMAFSVLVQEKIGIKWLGRRIFYMAPLHHAFQYRGLAETKVVILFWIIAGILAIIGLSTLEDQVGAAEHAAERREYRAPASGRRTEGKAATSSDRHTVHQVDTAGR